ncbi:hypothetical protein GQ42DRAFT_162907 [Ramicandelaber brevisporus]|nr:hypothetical protein GQ42DRAFT_162907 [Ramicandelaber brevisporus]
MKTARFVAACVIFAVGVSAAPGSGQAPPAPASVKPGSAPTPAGPGDCLCWAGVGNPWCESVLGCMLSGLQCIGSC